MSSCFSYNDSGSICFVDGRGGRKSWSEKCEKKKGKKDSLTQKNKHDGKKDLTSKLV